jgi:hypothetical protein
MRAKQREEIQAEVAKSRPENKPRLTATLGDILKTKGVKPI